MTTSRKSGWVGAFSVDAEVRSAAGGAEIVWLGKATAVLHSSRQCPEFDRIWTNTKHSVITDSSGFARSPANDVLAVISGRMTVATASRFEGLDESTSL